MNNFKLQLLNRKDWNFREVVEVILKNLPIAFAFLLPISQNLSTICLPIWVAFSLFNIKFKKLTINKAHFIPILYYALLMLSFLYSDKIIPRYFEYRMSLIVIPILCIINKDIIFEQRKKILSFFVYGCLAAVLICFINAFYNAIHFTEEGVRFSSKILEEFSLSNSILYGGNHFFATNFSILHQTVYFSMYLTFAALIVIEVPFTKRIVNWGLISVFVIAVICVLNRASYLVFFILGFFLIIRKIKSTHFKLLSIVLVMASATIVYNYNPRIKRNINNIKTFLNNEDQSLSKRNELINNIDQRVLLWNESIELIKTNLFFGLGLGDVEDELNARFKEKKLDLLIGLNSHNQYLQTLIEFGLIGFSLLLLLFYYVYRNSPEVYTNIIGISFIIIVGINFMFESMLSRYSGLSFIVFFYCVLTNFKKRSIS
ncbi:O-antigen ligase family protein [Aquimarina sp. 2304DJ70-9]|uniref:O-antigen ligase family protein n=1 Tax=Aquimarina penaris TaxID=3231044 RepID=UPI00346326EF